MGMLASVKSEKKVLFSKLAALPQDELVVSFGPAELSLSQPHLFPANEKSAQRKWHKGRG